MAVTVNAGVFERILEASKGAYPHECCGALLGKIEAGVKTVLDIRPLENMNKERAKDRYEINPLELMKTEKEAKAKALLLVGFYHSHPDHPSRPSAFDREMAWPEYSYIIVAVEKGTKTEARSWTFMEEGAPFGEEELKIG